MKKPILSPPPMPKTARQSFSARPEKTRPFFRSGISRRAFVGLMAGAAAALMLPRLGIEPALAARGDLADLAALEELFRRRLEEGIAARLDTFALSGNGIADAIPVTDEPLRI